MRKTGEKKEMLAKKCCNRVLSLPTPAPDTQKDSSVLLSRQGLHLSYI